MAVGRFHVPVQQSLLTLLREYLAAAADSSTTAPPLHQCRVQTAAVVDETATLHVLCLTRHRQPQQAEEVRLYWLTLSLMAAVTEAAAAATPLRLASATWLNRFAAPASVTIAGLAVASNGIAYAAFQQQQQQQLQSTIVMAHDGAALLSEVDVPSSPSSYFLKGSLAADVVTHGVTALEQTGLGLRLRLVLPESYSQQSQQMDAVTAAVPRLARHLRSAFWAYYDSSSSSRSQDPSEAPTLEMPPSLQHASLANLEAAVLAVAVELRDKGDRMGIMAQPQYQNPIQWHLALIDLLLQTGLYRKLSSLCKWSLLSIGQEVSVFVALTSTTTATMGSLPSQPQQRGWSDEQLQSLSAKSVGEWLFRVQASVLAGGSGEDRHEIWCSWLHTALETAVTYREERACPLYFDVLPNCLPRVNDPSEVPVWTSSPFVRRIVADQLAYWRSHGPVGVAGRGEMRLESILEYAVRSCGDSFSSCPQAETKQAYLTAQKASFEIVRNVRGLAGDEFLFDLAKKHRYFNGLCEIALTHERRSDRDQFALVPLFQDELGRHQELETDMKFGLYVLKWHTDRELYGHVMDYGKHCPEDLHKLMRFVDVLQPYRWIHSARQGDYNESAETLLHNAQKPSISIRDANLEIRLASISNKIAEDETLSSNGAASKRRRLIEKKTELIKAQFMLFGNVDPNSKVWDPKKLFDQALQKFDAAANKEDQVQACELALAICNSMEDDGEGRVAAQTVWLRAILVDDLLWKRWLSSEDDLASASLRVDVLHETVLGALLRLSFDTFEANGWQSVMFGSVIDDEALQELAGVYPLLENEGMRRLLHSVTREEHRDSSHGMFYDEAGGEMMVLEA